ncbi:carbohydrate-binding domain-containing protein [uncultured Devosia sp.]|uniref:carbohydrate-binding domain-containing protein n=1 Tax=uncultured Devosia sp. TaxID=211434 RepID=UPI002601DC01|nr:carbohydrate-binding domain-containing protein [uncultured Devosia sp.]
MLKISQVVLAKILGASTALSMLAILPAMADSLIVVSIAGEAYDGPPSFDLLINDKVIGSGTLTRAISTESDGRLFTKPRPNSFLEQFSFTIPDTALMPDSEISLVLTNDKFTRQEGLGEDGVLDRNLFIDFVRVNDIEITSAEMVLIHDGDEVHYNYQAGLLPIYEAGYRAVVRPPEGGWMAGGADEVAKVGMVDIPLPVPRPKDLTLGVGLVQQ